MNKNFLIASLGILSVVLVLILFRMTWLNMLWKNEAKINSEFAAKLYAANDIHKGKKVILRLKIEDDPTGYTSKPTEFVDGFVVREVIGYTDPFPVVGGDDSPSIQMQKIMVQHYNQRMSDYHADPDKYNRRLAKEIFYWNEEVLGNKENSNKSSASDGM